MRKGGRRKEELFVFLINPIVIKLKLLLNSVAKTLKCMHIF